MLDYSISDEELAELREAHRSTGDKREADRIKAVIALGTGWTPEAVAEILQIDVNTVRNHFKCYRQGGLVALRAIGTRVGGSPCLLTAEQLSLLDAHLQANLYLSAEAIARWVKETFDVAYTESGMTAVLHRLGYVYKKPYLVPGKADREAQEAFLEEYDKIMKNKGKDDPVYFMDAVHPQHNPVLAGGWIKLIFLPPYAPNLNLIERLWKFFKKKTLYNRDFETFDEFKTACDEFFRNAQRYHHELRSLLTPNFHIIG